MKLKVASALWCPACLIVHSRIKKLSKDYPELTVEFIDIDMQSEQAKEFDPVDVLPVFLLLDEEGSVIKRLTGELSNKQLIKEFFEHV
jgi:thiol-disulfide isomerase/thioredoxin